MKIGLQVSDFTWPGGPGTLAADLRAIARAAEDAGFARLAVADHLWQVNTNGPPENAMLEAYTTLGFLAACTSRIELLTWVSAVSFREPALLAKCVTTLDVLSGGRAWLGIGAGWFEEEARGLGLPFPPLAERFERLEEALQICLQMWSGDDGPYAGTHYVLDRTLNSPQPLQRPHPPILIGGGGERKTLRLVAQYAQACNLFADDDLAHKLAVLDKHCAAVGRDRSEIETTVVLPPRDPGPDGENTDVIVAELRQLATLGVDHVQLKVPRMVEIRPLELFGERIIPVVAAL
ncbi:alkanesulfonate monooxygenase [Pseudonocardia thermophila]|uniref:Alkanesulfonate monooxygenase n=1 Tax=Pseudonocardia thermophila TaxID=1848 RepID=A0A1M7BB44_PSETH|nr:LLM class F420-dependent oxidoreductase [Pseudonocardia thermophila]SHL51859.1 alkanesulfonate monooxygenase [Pseudonocardia thermophila]